MLAEWHQYGRWQKGVLLGLTAAALAGVALQPPLAQPQAYHDFADQRALYSVPHFWNVVSNVPFAVIGVLGCIWLVQAGRQSRAVEDRLPYFVFFTGEILTAFGSAYYHADPTNATLIWDRLPLSLMLTSMIAIVLAEFVDRRLGRILLGPMVILGMASVLYWAHGETQGRGDLRPYLLIQFYSMLATPVILLLFRSRYTHGSALWFVLALYASAKLAELYDRPVLDVIGFWSGHTIKHWFAAAASLIPLYCLQRRRLRRDLQETEEAPTRRSPYGLMPVPGR